MDTALRIIMEASETKVLPPQSNLPCFNDEIAGENLVAILQKVTGKRYDY